MRGEGHARQAVQAGPAEGHQTEKRPVHDCDAGVFQAFVHSAQNDLALFVLNAERRQAEHGVYVVDARIGRVEQVGRFGGDVPRLHAPRAADLLDGRRLVAVQYLNVGQCGELLQKPALEYLRIVGVLGGQERAVAEARVEVALGRNVVAADACRRAEPAEFRRVRPGEVRTGGVDLVKLGVQAEAVIIAEPLKIVRGLDGRGVAARVVVAHVDTGLVDVGRAHEGRGVALQHKDALPRRAAFLRRVQAVQPRAEDDFIVGHRAFPLFTFLRTIAGWIWDPPRHCRGRCSSSTRALCGCRQVPRASTARPHIFAKYNLRIILPGQRIQQDLHQIAVALEAADLRRRLAGGRVGAGHGDLAGLQAQLRRADA